MLGFTAVDEGDGWHTMPTVKHQAKIVYFTTNGKPNELQFFHFNCGAMGSYIDQGCSNHVYAAWYVPQTGRLSGGTVMVLGGGSIARMCTTTHMGSDKFRPCVIITNTARTA